MIEPSQTDADTAFARLEELLAQLEEIQEKDALLTQAREARELRDLKKRAAALEEEVRGYEEIKNKAIVDAKAANDAGDQEAEGKALALLRMYSELYSVRLAPQQRAAEAWRKAQEQSTLGTDAPLDDLTLEDGHYAALEKEVRDYREEYLACYELCKSFEEEEAQQDTESLSGKSSSLGD
ncbi:MAG: hypothetical protein LBG81_07410 [Coriobacteriaceae bacterium]|jgi:DNA repair exonuclease SbcCD ATPase subunit|nr:hypothetical protein [Coriobacteriaceae bacterium]